jgi:hypothetical protein
MFIVNAVTAAFMYMRAFMSKELDRCFARTVLTKQLQVVIDAIGAGQHMKSNMIEKLSSIYVQLVGDEDLNYQSMTGSTMIYHFKEEK